MLEIANRLGVGFTVKEVQFTSRAEAAQWIREHQANRRNVSKGEARLLRGREYNAAKKSESERASSGGKAKAKTGEKSTGSASGQNVHKQKGITPSEKTSSVLAKKHGVNEKTIRRDAVRAELHDAVKEADPKAAEKIASMPDKDVAEISKVTKEASARSQLLRGRVNCLTRKLVCSILFEALDIVKPAITAVKNIQPVIITWFADEAIHTMANDPMRFTTRHLLIFTALNAVHLGASVSFAANGRPEMELVIPLAVASLLACYLGWMRHPAGTSGLWAVVAAIVSCGALSAEVAMGGASTGFLRSLPINWFAITLVAILCWVLGTTVSFGMTCIYRTSALLPWRI